MVRWIAACARPPLPPPPAAAPGPSAEARAFFLRAEVAHATGDDAEAARTLAWVTRLDGQDPWSWVRVADLELRRGLPDAARTAADAALALDPDLPAAHRVAGLAALAGGDPGGALPHLARAADLPGVAAARVRAVHATGGDAGAVLATWAPAGVLGRLERAAVALEVGRAEDACRGWDGFDPSGRPAAVLEWPPGIEVGPGWDEVLAGLAAACGEAG